jgi:hypothetical protein
MVQEFLAERNKEPLKNMHEGMLKKKAKEESEQKVSSARWFCATRRRFRGSEPIPSSARRRKSRRRMSAGRRR